MVGYFYPRPPRGGRHLEALRVILGVEISIHALREEGDTWAFFAVAVAVFISIHALREEGDKQQRSDELQQRNFYPRPPRGGRPSGFNTFLRAICISIHALREEGDLRPSVSSLSGLNFYPRPPRGGRPHTYALKYYLFEFLSTPSARRATLIQIDWDEVARVISIHALREEGDDSCVMGYITIFNFYPRPPRGGRPWAFFAIAVAVLISIHALREEGDHRSQKQVGQRRNFYPRPPRGGRPGTTANYSKTKAISIHALREEGDPSKSKTSGTTM